MPNTGILEENIDLKDVMNSVSLFWKNLKWLSYFEQGEIVEQYFSEEDMQELEEATVNWNKKEFGNHIKFYEKK